MSARPEKYGRIHVSIRYDLIFIIRHASAISQVLRVILCNYAERLQEFVEVDLTVVVTVHGFGQIQNVRLDHWLTSVL